MAAKIVETEAYHGFSDRASHASRKRTPRNEIMFGGAGVAYIYLIYGMYHCLNIVTNEKDFPAAVLIRAVETDDEIKKTNGPGKLCRYLDIDLSLNKEDIIKSKKIWIEDRGEKISKNNIAKARRIGVEYAGESAFWQWRYYIKGSLYISQK